MLLLRWILTPLARHYGHLAVAVRVMKTSERRLTSGPTLNVLSRRFYALRCLRQSCGQLPPLLDQSVPFGGTFSHTSTRYASPASTTVVTPAVVVVVFTPTNFPATPVVAVPVVATVAASPFSPGFVLPTLAPGFGQTTGSGSSSWAISRALTRTGVGSAFVSLAWPRESRPLPPQGRPLAATRTSLTTGGRKRFTPPRSPTLRRRLPSVQTPCGRDEALEQGFVPGSCSLGCDTLRVRRRRGGRDSSRRSRRS